MTDVERIMYRVLLFLACVSLIISMVAGPIGRTSLSIAAAVSTVIISLSLIIYGLFFWSKKERR